MFEFPPHTAQSETEGRFILQKSKKKIHYLHMVYFVLTLKKILILLYFFIIPTVVTWNLIHAGSIWINHAHVTRYGFQSSNILLLIIIIITIMTFLYPTWTTSECVRLKSCWSVWNGLSRLNPGVLPLVINRSIKNIHSVATSISQDVITCRRLTCLEAAGKRGHLANLWWSAPKPQLTTITWPGCFQLYFGAVFPNTTQSHC